jgi:hypothetical protein
LSTHSPEDQTTPSGAPATRDAFANFRRTTAIGAIPLAIVINLLPVGVLGFSLLTSDPESENYDLELLGMLCLATPFFVVALVTAILQLRTKDDVRRSRILHRWTLGGLVAGLVISSIAVRV